ncbi:MAG: hypothetical protein RL220_703, partial [Bacteroidota bacterium]
MKPKPFQLLLLCSALILLSVFSCRKESFVTDPSATLEFSTDTVLFDTLFSTIGSTTRVVKVYNRHDENIRISRISLPENSPYYMVVDGVDGPVVEDIEIFAGDSMYIFVEVTIDPGNVNLPFLVEEDIEFITNGTPQNVHLMAYGQDAYFHGGLGGLNAIECDDVWT